MAGTLLLRQKDFPRVLKVGESIWTVRFVREIPGDTKGAKEITVGLADSEAQEILIRQGLTAALRLETFIHEVTHALEFEFGFQIPHAVLHKADKAWAQFLIENLLGGSTQRLKVPTAA